MFNYVVDDFFSNYVEVVGEPFRIEVSVIVSVVILLACKSFRTEHPAHGQGSREASKYFGHKHNITGAAGRKCKAEEFSSPPYTIDSILKP